ncbi:MAG: hypothetical protein WCF84_25885 [Anaerolineae bacterium]
MSKSKKQRKLNIDPAILARPRLESLFSQYAQGAFDLDALEANIRALMQDLGAGPVLDALVKRMEGTPPAERETLMVLLPRLKSQTVIDYLWQRIKKAGGLSLDAKMTAMVILKGLGEEVDIANPGLYLSPREIKTTDFKTVTDMMRMGLSGLARGLRDVRDAAEAEAYMHRIQQMPRDARDGTGILLSLVEQARSDKDELGADFLYAMAFTTPYPEVQQAAEQALAQLGVEGVKPVTRAVLDLGRAQFYAAYATNPNHPWQQNVVVGWERAAGAIQGISFLLDFGLPWAGAVKDMFVTQGMTPREFDRQFKMVAEQKMGERVYRISLARAQAMIAAAVQANQARQVAFPKEYNEARHLVERWVLHPPAAALAADRTQDELGTLPLVVEHEEQPLFLSDKDLKNPAVLDWLEGHAEIGPAPVGVIEEEEAEVQEIIRRANYPLPVQSLLTLGNPDQGAPGDTLPAGIIREHIPDLIRMATDRELHTAPGISSLVWAPVHAWRALGQLRAAEAVAPLTGLLRYIDEEQDDWIGEDLPKALGMIGPAALPVLDTYLADSHHHLWARVAAAYSIEEVGKHFPEARGECVAALTHTLAQYAGNDPMLNAYVMLQLVELQSVESAGLIERAFAARRIDEAVMGDWEEVQVELGLKPAQPKRKRSL